MVQYVLNTVNEYLTPFVAADEPDVLELYDDESENDFNDDPVDVKSPISSASSSSSSYSLSSEVPSPPSMLQETLVGGSANLKRTMSDLPREGGIKTHTFKEAAEPTFNLRRSYSEGARAPDLTEELNDLLQENHKHSSSVYSFVQFSPRLSRRTSSRTQSRNHRQPHHGGRVVEEIPEDKSHHGGVDLDKSMIA